MRTGWLICLCAMVMLAMAALTPAEETQDEPTTVSTGVMGSTTTSTPTTLPPEGPLPQ